MTIVFFILVPGLFLLGCFMGHPLAGLQLALLGFAAWLVLWPLVWLSSAFTMNYCEEYGYDMQRSCTNDEIQTYTEDHQ